MLINEYHFKPISISLGDAEMIIFILILAIFFWVGGYFITTYKMSNTGMFSKEMEKIIAPPKWLYYLCGAPHPKDYPRGTMRVATFRGQMAGILWMIYIIYSRIWKTSAMENLIGFALGLVIAFMLTSYVSKNYGVKDRAINRKKKKVV